ncbi:hypothetical protein HDU76_001056 [Blyttiomyces sp. JEL0837]|nr:hypothetical protein HDU76_001056 [Blyttiomyces sp. JEL0837]
MFESIFRSGLLVNERVIVTGGGTGIGRCTAYELATLGAHVIILGRRAELLEKTQKEILSSIPGSKCNFYTLNIRDDKDVKEVLSLIVKEHGRITGLVNNAGGQFGSPAEGISVNGWKAVIDLNLNGTWHVIRTLQLLRMDEGWETPLSIVNVVADVRNGKPWMSHTAAARAGVINLTKTLAQEWGKYGVRINCVAPGTLIGNGMNNYPQAVRERTVEIHNRNPIGRLGTEAEISSAIVYLISQGSSYITGAVLQVTGGAHLRKGDEDPEPYAETTRVAPYFGFKHVKDSGKGVPGYFADGKAPAGFEQLVDSYISIVESSKL